MQDICDCIMEICQETGINTREFPHMIYLLDCLLFAMGKEFDKELMSEAFSKERCQKKNELFSHELDAYQLRCTVFF